MDGKPLLAADRPLAGPGALVQERGTVILLGLRSIRRETLATDRFPGAGTELVLAEVEAAGGNDLRITARLAIGDRFESLHGDRPREVPEFFLLLPGFEFPLYLGLLPFDDPFSRFGPGLLDQVTDLEGDADRRFRGHRGKGDVGTGSPGAVLRPVEGEVPGDNQGSDQRQNED